MASEIPLRPISYGAAVFSGFAFKSEDFSDTGIPVVKIKNVNNRVVDFAETEFFPIAKVTNKHAKFFLRDGDVLIAMTGQGSVGRVGRVRLNSEKQILLNQRVGKFSTDPKKLDLDYLYYVISTPRYEQILFDAGSGSGQPNLSPQTICSVEIPFPPLAEQKAIAAVLGALDDKIELNRRMNATLEAMARALFRSWFVDFDPVRAKLDGRQPAGLDPATAALFPNEFENSELGPIPKGWRVGKVEQILIFDRSTLDPSDFPNELFAHYSLPAFDEGRVPKLELGNAIKSQKLIVSSDAVLLSKLNPHIPRIWLPDVSADNRALCSTEFLVAQPRAGASRDLLFCLFTSDAFASDYGTLVTGTTGSHQRVKGESVLQMKVVIPLAAVIDQFSALAKPMFDKVIRNIRESATLAGIRDTLLPKLLSGELKATAAVT